MSALPAEVEAPLSGSLVNMKCLTQIASLLGQGE